MRPRLCFVVAVAVVAASSSPTHAAPAFPGVPTPTPTTAPAEGASPELSPIEPHNTCKRQPMHSRFRITLDREARLVDLVRWMSSVTCTKFIWSPGIRDGKVTVVSPESVTMQQAWAAFYASLATMGLTVEQSGEYLKIVESKDPNKRVVPIYGPGETPPPRDRFVTQLYRPNPGRTADVMSVVQHLAGPRGTVTAVDDLVIITDTGASIERILKVVEQVDTPIVEQAHSIFLVPLTFADPEEVAGIVREVFMQSTSTAAPKTKSKTKTKGTSAPSLRPVEGAPSTARVHALTIDARTRTVIVTTTRADFPTVAEFIARLDAEPVEDGSTLFVLPLKHADPEEIAQVLGSLPTAQSGNPAGGAAPSGRAPAKPAPKGGVSIGGSIHVTADPSTRSLVIMASPRDFLALRRVVAALDVERRLVYVEAYILELSSSQGMEFGAAGHYMGARADGTGGFVSSSPGDTSSALLDTSVLSGLAAGIVGPSAGDLLGLGQDIPSFGVLIQALENNEDINIVSEPHLYTADNKTARMSVGKNIPVPSGTSTFNGTAQPVTQTNYQREEVALDLEVTPHVGEGDTLTLDIKIDNREVGRSEFEGGPNTTSRKLELEAVIARDGQPVVLGGLVQEKEEIVDRKVPGLGNIPLLGWLFKNRQRRREKVNLLVVLVPHVLDSPDDRRRIHQRRLAERREMLERQTAFARRDLETHVNYRRKSGLLAAVQAEASAMTQESEFRSAASQQLERSIVELAPPPPPAPVTPTVAGP